MVIGIAAGLSAGKLLPAIGGVALKVIPAIGVATSAAASAGKIAATVTTGIKVATGVIGVGKLAIIPVLIAALAYYHYDVFDPENRPFNVKEVDHEYDFIVVGAGGAGAVVASRLSEIADWKVLLLEAGGHETEISDVPLLSLYLHKSKLDWKYRTQPQKTACQAMIDKRCCWTRGKVLGGSTVLNTMLYIRGNKRDFDLWEALGNKGWSYEDILPYFRKSEDQRNPYLARNKRQHGTGGPLTIQDAPYLTPIGPAFLQAAEEQGYDIVDINGEQQTGFAFFQFHQRRGQRCSTAKAFLRPARLRKNLHIALFAHVTKVIMDETNKRALGIEFIRNGRKQQAFVKREVILSAGAIGTPHLLMLSGIGPKKHLEKFGINVIHDSPGVGRNLQDHIAAGGLVFQIDHPVGFVMNRLVNINSAVRYAVTEDGPLTSNVGLEAVGFISTKYANQSDDWPDIEFHLTSASITSDDQAKVAHGLTDEFFNYMYNDVRNKDVFGVFPMMLRPKSRGYIKLQSKNPLRYPLIYHNYFTHPDDVAVLREGVKAAISLVETQAMKKFGARFHDRKVPNCKHLEMYTDEYWDCSVKQYTMTIYHYCGTAKMGTPDDPFAVVDNQLRVYGVQGLRVIDASIMPTVTSGNIVAPVIMIGEKGSDQIKALWLQSKDDDDYRYKRQENSTLNTNLDDDDAEKRIKRQDNTTLSSNQKAEEKKISS